MVDKYLSLLEAVLTRGDESLCKYIEALYKKGCYLDAWGEYFKENVWYDTAKELNINLSKLAQKEYKRDDDSCHRTNANKLKGNISLSTNLFLRSI